MSGAGGGSVHVSSWGLYTDDDGVEWQRWSIRVHDVRVGYLELPPEQRAMDALTLVVAGFDIGD